MLVNTNKIKSISSRYDEFNDDKIILSLMRLYDKIIETDGKLYYYRDLVRQTENELVSLRKEFNEKSSLYDIEYEKKDLSVIEKDRNVPLIFKNGKILKG